MSKVPKTKTKRNFDDPLSIGNEMRALDEKRYDYYDLLTDQQKKLFSPYLLLRWGACVEGSSDIASYYTVAFNEFANSNFWTLNKHRKLQWLSLCAAAPAGLGPQRHYWLGAAKKDSGSKIKKQLLKLLPTMKTEDIDRIIEYNTAEEIAQWLLQNGLDPKHLE